MTIEEFKKQKWYEGMRTKYNDEWYDIWSVDFVECLVAIDETKSDGESLSWKRCENLQEVKL